MPSTWSSAIPATPDQGQGGESDVSYVRESLLRAHDFADYEQANPAGRSGTQISPAAASTEPTGRSSTIADSATAPRSARCYPISGRKDRRDGRAAPRRRGARGLLDPHQRAPLRPPPHSPARCPARPCRALGSAWRVCSAPCRRPRSTADRSTPTRRWPVAELLNERIRGNAAELRLHGIAESPDELVQRAETADLGYRDRRAAFPALRRAQGVVLDPGATRASARATSPSGWRWRPWPRATSSATAPSTT